MNYLSFIAFIILIPVYASSLPQASIGLGMV